MSEPQHPASSTPESGQAQVEVTAPDGAGEGGSGAPGGRAPFSALRAAYLRTIASIWRDNTDTKLQAVIEHSKNAKHGALKMFRENYQVEFPFSRVKLVFSRDEHKRPRWLPVGTRGWFGFADQFIVTLPARPADPEDQVTLLAEYMQEFPSMLGRGKTEHDSAEVEAPAEFGDFGLVTGRLIALAWRDEDFANRLFDKDASDVVDLVEGAMGIKFPWHFGLQFRKYVVPKRPAPHDGPIFNFFNFDDFPPTEILLYIPRRPEEQDERAIALAAYNDTGAQYPFTCG